MSKADKATKKRIREAYKEVGEPVRQEAQSLFASVDARSAAGYRVRVRTRGVSVEQSRKNRGGSKRPNYTAMQMNEALTPALEAKEKEIVVLFEKAMDDIADIVERG